MTDFSGLWCVPCLGLLECEWAFPGNTCFVTLSYVFYSTAEDERLAKYKYKFTTHCLLEKWGINLEKLFPLNSVLWKCVILKKKRANVTSKQSEEKQFYNLEVILTLRVSLSRRLWLFIPVCLLVLLEEFLNPRTGETRTLSCMSVEWCELEIFLIFFVMELETRFLVHKAFYAVGITTLWHRLLRSVWEGSTAEILARRQAKIKGIIQTIQQKTWRLQAR